MTQSTDIARPAKRPPPVSNGHDPERGHMETETPNGKVHPQGFTRPYVVESQSFANRLEVDLHYADSELAVVRAHIAALHEREADLVKIRDASLTGLGILTRNEDEPDVAVDA